MQIFRIKDNIFSLFLRQLMATLLQFRGEDYCLKHKYARYTRYKNIQKSIDELSSKLSIIVLK